MWVHAGFVTALAMAAPLVPVLVRQGRRVRDIVPAIPEARDPDGRVGEGPRLTVLTLGESTVAGVGVSRHADGLTGHLASTLGDRLGAEVAWHVFARNGVTAQVVADELVEAAAHLAPDLVVVGLGGNDTFRLTPTWRWQRQVRRLVERVRATFGDVPVVFAQMPPIHHFPAFPSPLRQVLSAVVGLHGRALAAEVRRHRGVWFATRPIPFDAVAHAADPPLTAEAFFCDGVHPSELAYRIWGETLAAEIAETAAIRGRLPPSTA